MAAWLVGLDGELGGRRFTLDTPCLVGRGPYNHVVLDDTRISRQHGKISPEAGGHVAYDLNSANGTFVNDVQVKRQRLQPNDILRFGPFRFRFDDDGAQQVATTQSKPPSKFVEVLTLVGVEAPAKITGSLDATLVREGAPGGGLRQLEDAERKLRTLYSFMHAISATLDQDELLDRIGKSLFEIFANAETVTIYLREKQARKEGEADRVHPRKVLRRDDKLIHVGTLPGQFHDEVVRKGRSVLSSPLGAGASLTAGRGVSMHAPMIHRLFVHGVIHVRAGDDDVLFSQADLDLLTGVAAQAAVVMQNARLHQESLKQQRIQQDLLLAEQIQKSFLPRNLPAVEGIEFVTEYRPAFSVGGDFYDVFWLSYDRIGMFVGDVAGKGVSAALLMARISSDLRLAAAAVADPARALEHVNRIVLERRQHETFVTCVYLTLDIHTREATLANAGHVPPLIRRRAEGKVESIDHPVGTAIGIFDDAEYDQVKFSLDPGDSLILCTDGVLEATNAQGEQFGQTRMMDAVTAGSAQTQHVAARIQEAVRTHVGDAPQIDDLTLILCGIRDVITPERQRRRDEPTQMVPSIDD